MKLKYYLSIFIVFLLQFPVGSFAQGLIIPSRTYFIANSGNLVLYKNLVDSGTFTHNGGTLIFAGTTQKISGTSHTVFNNITIASTSKTTINAPCQSIKKILLCNDTLNANANLTLLSTAAQTALIDGSGTGQVLGNVTMQRYLDTSFGYKYISSPFIAATIGQLSGYVNLSAVFPSFYGYNENVSYAGWVMDTAAADTIKPMYGYAANFGSVFSNATFSLTGIVSNGAMTKTLYNHNNTYTLGFNLVGNPYPSPINWTASSGWTKTNIDNAIYYFNHGDTNRYYGRYNSYINGISSDGVATNIIPAMQGFFVHVTNGSYPVTATLACTNAVRTNNPTPYYHKQTSGNRPLVRIDAGFLNGLHSDPTVIYFDDLASAGFDKELDALKLMNTDAAIPSLYSVSQDENMSIQALPTPTDSNTDMIPLGLITEQDGWVDFNTRTIEMIPAGMHVYFLDAATGVVQDLRSTPKYSRYLNKGKYQNRFFLMLTFKDKTDIPVFNSELNAYTYGNNLFVYLTYGSSDLIITNMAGQIILKQQLNSNGYHQIYCPFVTGIYVVTLFSNMGKQSKKILINTQ